MKVDPSEQTLMVRYCLLCLAFLVLTPAVRASWAQSLFEEHSRDFGSVPHGPMLSHPFRLVNNTRNSIRISNIRVTCGCVKARALQSTLAPGQETAILVQMDTNRFYNTKHVTIYVQFDRPSFEEVRLWVQANSRNDVTVVPDTLAMGRVKRGSSPSATVTMTFLGDSQFQVQEVKCDSNYVQLSYKEGKRKNGEVNVHLTATVRPDAPVGKWFTDVWVKTNIAKMAPVRVPLTVEIESPLSITPNTIDLGKVKAGHEVEKRIFLRGIKSFRITHIAGTDSQVLVKENTSNSKTVHVLTVVVRPFQPGEIHRIIQVRTDIPNGGDIEFTARALVVP